MKQRFSSRRLSPLRNLRRASITSRSGKIAYALKAMSPGAEPATLCCGTCGQPMRWSASGRMQANWPCFEKKTNGCGKWSDEPSKRCDGRGTSSPPNA
jgi:hypothetical protein